jgi:hypothetical protein
MAQMVEDVREKAVAKEMGGSSPKHGYSTPAYLILRTRASNMSRTLMNQTLVQILTTNEPSNTTTDEWNQSSQPGEEQTEPAKHSSAILEM